MIDRTNRPGPEEEVRELKNVIEFIERDRIYQAIGESIDLGIWICDPDGKNIYVSQSFLRLVGMTQEQCSNFGWGDVLHPDDAVQTIADWKECARTCNTWDREHRFRGVDGLWYPVLSRGVAVKDEQGRVKCWAGINLDIRRIKAAEEALQRLNESLEMRVRERTEALQHVTEKLEDEITERRMAEERALRLNRLYSVRGRVSEAIVNTRDIDELYCKACRIVVECGLFKMSWIGLSDPETREVKPAAHYGDEGGFLDNIRIIAADQAEGKDPTGRAIYELKSVVCRDIEKDLIIFPWSASALSQGFRSSAAFPLRSGSVVVGALTVYSEKKQSFSNEEIYLLESLAADISHAADAIMSEKRRLRAEEELRTSREQLRDLSQHLVDAREEERIRIGREIHDEIGQILTAANIELALASRECRTDNLVSKKIDEVSELIDVAIEDIQRICSELRPRVLDHLGLVPALEWQAAEFSMQSGIQCNLDLPKHDVNLSRKVSTALFRIFQEALTHIAHQSEGGDVSVCLRVEGTIFLEVRHSGQGTETGEVAFSNAYGIIGIKERVRRLGGTVEFSGLPDGSTTMRVNIPTDSQEDCIASDSYC